MKTIFFLNIEYNNEFFTELINSDFTYNDKIVENYLKKSLKGEDFFYSNLLSSKFDKIKDYILYPKKFFEIISKNIMITFNEQPLDVNEIYEIYTKDEKSEKLIPLTTFVVDNLFITNCYLKITYNTYKIISVPNIKLHFILKELKPNEPIPHSMIIKIYKFWKNRLKDFWSFFQKK